MDTEVVGDVIIAYENPDAVEFVRMELPEIFGKAPVVTAPSWQDIKAKVVAGNLPLYLAAEAAMVWTIMVPNRFGPAVPAMNQSLGELRGAHAYMEIFLVSEGPYNRLPWTVLEPGAKSAVRRAWLKWLSMPEFGSPMMRIFDYNGPGAPSKLLVTEEEAIFAFGQPDSATPDELVWFTHPNPWMGEIRFYRETGELVWAAEGSEL